MQPFAQNVPRADERTSASRPMNHLAGARVPIGLIPSARGIPNSHLVLNKVTPMSIFGPIRCLAMPVLTVALLLMASATIARGGVITYTDRAAWVAALTAGPTTDDLDDLDPGTLPASPLARAGYTVETADIGNFYVVETDSPDLWVSSANPGVGISFTFLTPQTAVGLSGFLTNVSGLVEVSGGTVTATFGSEALQQVVIAPKFFGFTSSVPFSSLTLTTSDTVNYMTFNDVEIGSFSDGAAVPEPASALLVGIGLGGLTFRSFRRLARNHRRDGKRQ